MTDKKLTKAQAAILAELDSPAARLASYGVGYQVVSPAGGGPGMCVTEKTCHTLRDAGLIVNAELSLAQRGKGDTVRGFVLPKHRARAASN